MPDEKTITLPVGDWDVILAGLNELPGKFCIPVINRLVPALQEARKGDSIVPFGPLGQGSAE